MNSVSVSNKKNSNPKISNNIQNVIQLQSKLCTCLTWALIGILVGSLALAPVIALYTHGQSQTFTSNSTKQKYYCCGISSYTLWQPYFTDGITMTINTSNCSFDSTPVYFTSVAGNSAQYILNGYGAIYSPTKNVFSIYARWSTGLSVNQTLTLSQQYRWNINWFGIIK